MKIVYRCNAKLGKIQRRAEKSVKIQEESGRILKSLQ
jgi:hypothetical protein